MKELKGTKTEKNLMEAFAGESMARNKYTYFASNRLVRFLRRLLPTRKSTRSCGSNT